MKEREQALSERERKVQEWENAQREAAKNHGFYGVAQIEEHNYRSVIKIIINEKSLESFTNFWLRKSQKFKFSGVGEGAGESVRAMLESVSGRSLANLPQAIGILLLGAQ